MNKRVLHLAIPNIISNITVPLVGLVDMLLMGHMESEAYIGAISLGAIIFTFIYSGFGFLRMGTSGITAQALGRRDLAASALTLSRALLVAWSAGLFMIIAQNAIGWTSFQIMSGASEQVSQLAASYFYIRIWAAPATLGVYALSGWFLGMQNAKIPMTMAITVNLLNLGFNVLFVFGFNMGSDGVALGTVLAQYTGLALGLFFFFRYYSRMRRFWNRDAIMNSTALKAFFSINKDILIRSLLLTGCLFFFTAKSAIYTDTILAANALLMQFLWIFSYFIDGFAFAAEALVGKAIGGRNRQQLKTIIHLVFKWGLALSALVAAIYYISGPLIMRLLTNQVEVIATSKTYMWWIWLLPFLTFTAYLWDGIYVGATASRAMRNAMVVCTLLVFLPAYYLFEPLWGNHGLWLSLMLFMTSRGLILHLLSNKAIYGKL